MLARILRGGTEPAYVLLRVVAGSMFAFHGLQKTFGVLAASQPDIGTQLWLGGVIELITGLGIAAGFHTMWMAFLASGTMAVAYAQFHWKLDLGERIFPAINKGELALLYAVLFLYISGRGGGRWSIDRMRRA